MPWPAIHQRRIPAAAVLTAGVVTLAAMAASLAPGVTFEAQRRLSHAALLVVVLTGAGLALHYRQWTLGVLDRFFGAVARPLNLALYRIVLFGTIFLDLDHDARPRVITFFAGLPKALQVPPPGLGPILKYLPINEALATWTLHGLTTFSFLAMIGLCTRVSAVLAVACGLYALGIPQYYGQVNHYHHMLWFAAILAASRCGDVLSVDAYLAARRNAAGGGTVEPPGESRAYALPLRLVWLTIGVLYFFPGFWKFWHSGFDWAFSENFKYQLHLKWMQRDWVSPLRIDHLPILYMPAALATLVWEMGFLPAMFFPRLRMLGAVVGAMFHVSTRILMHISFWTLQTSYLSFFNWDAIFRRLGRKVYARQMLFLYDGRDAAVRRRLASWRTLDVFFGRVTYVDIRDEAAMAAVGVPSEEPSRDAAEAPIIVNSHTDGAAAWRALAGRIPPLWPVLPLVGLFTRSSAAPDRAERVTAPATGRMPAPGLRAVTVTFLVILVGNLAFGFKENRTGYPFTCYPPFSRILGPQAQVIHIDAIGADGRTIPWDEKALKKRFGSARYVSLIKHLRTRPNEEQFRAFWQVVRREFPHVRDAQTVNFWESTVRTDPAYHGHGPVERRLVYQFEQQTPPAGSPAERASTLTSAGELMPGDDGGDGGGAGDENE